MTIVEITDGHLWVVVEGMDKVLALKSTIEIPLAHVRGASSSPDALREPHGLRLLGTSVPGVIAAGSFYDGEWLFMDVHNHVQAVKIELDHEHYAALIVEVEDPAATVSTINAAVRGLGSGSSQGAPRATRPDARDPGLRADRTAGSRMRSPPGPWVSDGRSVRGSR